MGMNRAQRRACRSRRSRQLADGAPAGDGFAAFAIEGSPDFVSMMAKAIGADVCDVPGCNGIGCGRWHVFTDDVDPAD